MLKGFPAFPSRAAALRSMGEYTALVGVSHPPGWKVWMHRAQVWVGEWDLGAWLRVPWTIVWPVSLGVLMMYMHQQRIKVLGHGKGLHGGRLKDHGGKKKA